MDARSSRLAPAAAETSVHDQARSVGDTHEADLRTLVDEVGRSPAARPSSPARLDPTAEPVVGDGGRRDELLDEATQAQLWFG